MPMDQEGEVASQPTTEAMMAVRVAARNAARLLGLAKYSRIEFRSLTKACRWAWSAMFLAMLDGGRDQSSCATELHTSGHGELHQISWPSPGAPSRRWISRPSFTPTTAPRLAGASPSTTVARR